MPAYISLGTTSSMREKLKVVNSPSHKTFGPYANEEIAKEALKKMGWKWDSPIGWHSLRPPCIEKPYCWATIAVITDILCDPAELPEA